VRAGSEMEGGLNWRSQKLGLDLGIEDLVP
jgi:hypothetical protein